MAGEPELTVLSLGGGVQSSVAALMAADGLLRPRPDFAIFADTGWEPDGVYRHLEWLRDVLPFPVKRVQRGDLRADLRAGVNSTGQRFSSVPVFVKSLSGKAGIARRQCTREYKLSPIEAELRDLLGLGYRQAVPDGVYVELWIGISTDEAALRMKASRERWIEHRWPLVELGYSRDDCRAWFAERWPGRVLPRSACIGCPYHTDAEWAEMKRGDPRSWADAIFVDDALRADGRADRFAGEVYLHQSLTPLSAIAFGDEPQQGELFDAECEGMCGV